MDRTFYYINLRLGRNCYKLQENIEKIKSYIN